MILKDIYSLDEVSQVSLVVSKKYAYVEIHYVDVTNTESTFCIDGYCELEVVNKAIMWAVRRMERNIDANS